MFYKWYYAPIFRARFPGDAKVELFEMSAMEKESLELSKHQSSRHLPVEVRITTDTGIAAPLEARTEPSPEYIALSKAAIQGDTLIWTLVGLTSALNSYVRSSSEVVSMLALVFSILNDPQNVLQNVLKNPLDNIPSLVCALFPMFHQLYKEGPIASHTLTSIIASRLPKCQYHPKSALGERLQEDVRLWLKAAADAGLQHELEPCREEESKSNEEVIAGTLLGLLLQSWPWVARVLPSTRTKLEYMVVLERGCLRIGSDAKLAIKFLRQLQAIGINFDLDDDATKMPSVKNSQRKPLRRNLPSNWPQLILYGHDIPPWEILSIWDSPREI